MFTSHNSLNTGNHGTKEKKKKKKKVCTTYTMHDVTESLVRREPLEASPTPQSNPPVKGDSVGGGEGHAVALELSTASDLSLSASVVTYE